jgi:hypothetical protein
MRLTKYVLGVGACAVVCVRLTKCVLAVGLCAVVCAGLTKYVLGVGSCAVVCVRLTKSKVSNPTLLNSALTQHGELPTKRIAATISSFKDVSKIADFRRMPSNRSSRPAYLGDNNKLKPKGVTSFATYCNRTRWRICSCNSLNK